MCRLNDLFKLSHACNQAGSPLGKGKAGQVTSQTYQGPVAEGVRQLIFSMADAAAGPAAADALAMVPFNPTITAQDLRVLRLQIATWVAGVHHLDPEEARAIVAAPFHPGAGTDPSTATEAVAALNADILALAGATKDYTTAIGRVGSLTTFAHYPSPGQHDPVMMNGDRPSSIADTVLRCTYVYETAYRALQGEEHNPIVPADPGGLLAAIPRDVLLIADICAVNSRGAMVDGRPVPPPPEDVAASGALVATHLFNLETIAANGSQFVLFGKGTKAAFLKTVETHGFKAAGAPVGHTMRQMQFQPAGLDPVDLLVILPHVVPARVIMVWTTYHPTYAIMGALHGTRTPPSLIAASVSLSQYAVMASAAAFAHGTSAEDLVPFQRTALADPRACSFAVAGRRSRDEIHKTMRMVLKKTGIEIRYNDASLIGLAARHMDEAGIRAALRRAQETRAASWVATSLITIVITVDSIGIFPSVTAAAAACGVSGARFSRVFDHGKSPIEYEFRSVVINGNTVDFADGDWVAAPLLASSGETSNVLWVIAGPRALLSDHEATVEDINDPGIDVLAHIPLPHTHAKLASTQAICSFVLFNDTYTFIEGKSSVCVFIQAKLGVEVPTTFNRSGSNVHPRQVLCLQEEARAIRSSFLHCAVHAPGDFKWMMHAVRAPGGASAVIYWVVRNVIQ